MEAEKIEKLEKTLAGFELIQGDIQKALASGEKVADLAKDLDAQRAEIETVKAAMKASGEAIPALVEKRLTDIDKRLGRINASGGADNVGEPLIQKSFGAQLTDLIQSDPNFREAAKSGRGTGRIDLTGSTIRKHFAVLETLKAAGLRATDEEMQIIAKAMLLSDNATITPIQRLTNVLPMGGRRRFLSDIIPSQNVEVGTIEYLEYMGLAPGTYLTATSVASTGLVATLTYTAHGARVGDRIHVKDSTDTDYNGFFIVESVPTADTLTYTMAADPADDTADGTILWANLSTWGAAATVAENALKPESALATRTVNAYIELIAHIFRVSKQLIDDVPGLQAAINSAGVRGLQELKEYKLLYGDGTSNTIDGFMHRAGVQAYTQATSGDKGLLVAFRHTLTMLENVGAMAQYTIINPNDREAVDVATDLADRFYMDTAPQSGTVSTLWSTQLLSTRWIAPKSALVGDFAEGATILNRQGTQISFSESDGDDFKYNRLAMRFEERMGLAIQRPEFFVKLTLL
jgi:hypothetical protein